MHPNRGNPHSLLYRRCDRRSRLLCGVAAALLIAVEPADGVAPASAMQGPNNPSTVVDDPSVGALAWSDPQNAAVSDDQDAFFSAFPSSGTSHYLKATGFGFSVPNVATIDGIQVAMEVTGVLGCPSSEVDVLNARIVKGGTIGATNRVAEDVTFGGPADLWGETWTASDINAADFGFAFSIETFGELDCSPLVAVDAIAISVFYSFQCEGGQPLDCDDGNLCTQDSCDPVNGCVHDGSPAVDCRTALKSLLILKDKSPDEQDKLVWKWSKGAATTQAEFGVPTGTTQYALCIYAGLPAPLVYAVGPDPVKWSPVGEKGYKYKDPTGSAAGITKLLLKGGAQSASTCRVKGAGANLADAALEQLDDAGLVTVQLVNDSNSVCFESAFTAADFRVVDDPAKFKAKSP